MGALRDRPASIIPVPYGYIAVWTEERTHYTELHISVVRQNKAIEHSLSSTATASLLRALAIGFSDQLAHKRERMNNLIKEREGDIKELEARLAQAPESSPQRKRYEARLAEAREWLEALKKRQLTIEQALHELKILRAVLEDLAETDAL